MKCRTCEFRYLCDYAEELSCKRNNYCSYHRDESVYDEDAEELAKLLLQISSNSTYIEAAKFLLDNGVIFTKI